MGNELSRSEDLNRKPVNFRPADMGHGGKFQQLLDLALERGYLSGVSECAKFRRPLDGVRPIQWLQVTRLPIHPGDQVEYELLARWQSILATMHTWGHRLNFLMLRDRGEARLYLGTSQFGKLGIEEAIEQVRQATSGSMPGIELTPLSKESVLESILAPLMDLPALGSVTGIPSLRHGPGASLLQTFDQLAFGVKNRFGEDISYGVLVVADPLEDRDITEAISEYRNLGSQIHGSVKRNSSESTSHSESMSSSTWKHTLSKLIPIVGEHISQNRAESLSSSQSASSEDLNKFAEYAEQLTDQHVERLKRGRNLGFWNAGVYILGQRAVDVKTVGGMLRSVYSGDNSFIEPIRVHSFRADSNAGDSIRRFQLVGLGSNQSDQGEAGWNPLGPSFESVSTPMNTEELSIATSLPRRDVNGLRFVRTSVSFTANSPSKDGFVIGPMIDKGVRQSLLYRIDHQALVRHALICGTPGSGKSTTCQKILDEVRQNEIPFLMVEPAKDDYVRWALRMNQKLPKEDRIRIYMPGVKKIDGIPLDQLALNPFEPAHAPGATVDLLTRCERLTAILNASLPMTDVLPVLLDEAIYRYLSLAFGELFTSGEMEPSDQYPKLDGLLAVARQIIMERKYERRIQDDLIAAMETRLTFLLRGKRGQLLNVERSIDYHELFSRPAIINLSLISNSKDKALVMALLLLAVQEYRVSIYTNDADYRAAASANQLKHLTVIEEAHHLLMNPGPDLARVGNAQQAVADMFSEMLSEVRGYGQGLLIVDQLPSRLIPDVIKNTNYKIVHRLPAKNDREAVAACMALRSDQQQIIASLAIGEAIVYGDLDDGPCWVHVNAV
jgi:DNA helicase HerA-like ATPase